MQCIDVAAEMYALVMCLWREAVIWAIYVFGKSAINSLAINTWKVGERNGWVGEEEEEQEDGKEKEGEKKRVLKR